MNLSQIRTNFFALLNRNDCTTELANYFIQMGQTRIERTLRIPIMETTSVITGNSDPVTDQIVIPANFLSLKHMITGSTLMSNLDLGRFLNYKATRLPSGPEWYSRVGSSFLIWPPLPQDQAISVVYYGSQPQLVNDTDTNTFSITAPDVLLYAAMSYACDHFVDDRTAAFEARYSQLYSDLDEQGTMTDMDQSTQAIAPAHSDY